MSKKKRAFEVSPPGRKDRKKKASGKKEPADSLKPVRPKKIGFFADPGVRETIESIVVAIILALLFRAYEAEAFVIPTGSMAPTLQGRHLDLFCQECGYNFRVGASGENPDRKPMRVSANGHVEVDPDMEWYTGHATCPICRHTRTVKRNLNGGSTNEDSFYGDRIIVSKFAYELNDPERWDVVVFKYPPNQKQNYIKRLIGLPGETIKLEFGNVYVRNEKGEFDICRKPPIKLKTILQLVDDTHHISKTLKQVDWPSRWNEWTAKGEPGWQVDNSGTHPRYLLKADDSEHWLRYKHLVPTVRDWMDHLANGELPPRLADFKGQLIADFYAYNFFVPNRIRSPHSIVEWMSKSIDEEGRYLTGKLGVHWVPDLAVECDLEVTNDTGELKFDIVKAGIHFVCSIDVNSGLATLTASDRKITFVSADEKVSEAPSGMTPIRGPGKYRIRYANCDDKLYLWVNEKVIQFDGPTEYENLVDQFLLPHYSDEDPGDALPVGIAGKGVSLEIKRLKILRDVFYINTRTGLGFAEYEYRGHPTQYNQVNSYEEAVHVASRLCLPIRRIFEDPASWDSDEARELFSSQIHTSPGYFYELDQDQFMPLGDNSPSSMDARAWDHGHYFERKHLIGKALFIYWPHAWRWPTLFPNFKRMSFIR